MKVLVTGGAGFIGSHVAERFVSLGHEVAVLDNLSTGFREFVPPQARFYPVDITDGPAVDRCLAEFRPDIVDHHAAQIDVRVSVTDPRADADRNVLGLLNVLEGAREGKVGRVVFASSGGTVYGDGAGLPTPETAPKLPASPYGVAKLASEYYLATFTQLYGLEAAVLRYSNVYGPRQDPHGEAGVVAIFCRRIIAGEPLTVCGDGTQTRDMVFVGDVALANVIASRQVLPALSGLDARAYNVGTGVETSVNELAEQLGVAAGRRPDIRHAPARPGEIQRSALHPGKARRELGWQPATTLGAGLAATLRWFMED